MTSKRAMQVSAITAAGILLAAYIISRNNGPGIDPVFLCWMRLQTAASGWFMQLLGIPIWADNLFLHTDLYTYAIRHGYHAAGVACASCGVAITIILWRRYHGMEAVYLVGAALASTLIWNVVRITLLIRYGPPPDTAAMTSLLRDTTMIMAAMMSLSLWFHVVMVESARYVRRQKQAPIPHAISGTVSRLPPFWHQTLRRYRPFYLCLPIIAMTALILFASRPTRRTALLAQLVINMAEQENHALALRLGNIVATARPDDLSWQLRLIRIKLLAGETEQALQALAQLPKPATQEQATEVALLAAHGHSRAHDWTQAQTAIARLQNHAEKDPIWYVILLELALIAGDQDNVIEWLPQAVQAYSQRQRLQPAIPMLQSSGAWNTFLTATQWIPREETPPATLSAQIMAQLQLNRTGIAAEETQFALQHWPNRTEFLPAILVLTQLNPTEWEPRLTQYLLHMYRSTDNPNTLFMVINAAFAVHRPDVAWQAYKKLRELRHTLHADLALASHASQWFRMRSHALQLPADTLDTTTDLTPWIILGKHFPLLHFPLASIPYAGHIEKILNPETWQQTHRNLILPQLLQQPYLPLLTRNHELLLHTMNLLEEEHTSAQAYQDLTLIQAQHPDMQAITDFQLARLDIMMEQPWRAYTRLRTLLCDNPPLTRAEMQPDTWPPTPMSLKPQTASQLPLLIALMDVQWKNRQYRAAHFTAHEALQRFPENVTIRTMAADILLQLGHPDQALHVLEKTATSRQDAVSELEAEALLATGRLAALRRQRRLTPANNAEDVKQPERLPPAEALFSLPAPEHRSINPPVAQNPVYPLFQHVAANPTEPPDWNLWIETPTTRLEQAEAMFLLSQLLYAQNRHDKAQRASRLAVKANPHDPTLWLALLPATENLKTLISVARQFCPDDPDLWLADLVCTAYTTDHAMRTHALQRILHDAIAVYDFPVETLVRAADFLWRGNDVDNATSIINRYYNKERGLLAAHLLGLEAAEHAGDQNRALYHIEAAIETAGHAAPELYARFIRSKIRTGQLNSDANVIHALRQLRAAEPENIFWTELLGFVRQQRGGADRMEAGLEMRYAIRAGSTNRAVFVIAAEGYRRVNRTHDAADILRQGLALWPQDALLLNNLAYTLAENPATTQEATKLIPQLNPLAETNPEIRATLAFVLLRNNQHEAAHTLLSQNLRETAPDSRIWFRSQMHLAEIVWHQGRSRVAASMLEQLLRGVRNIPDEDVLTANRLLQQITANP